MMNPDVRRHPRGRRGRVPGRCPPRPGCSIRSTPDHNRSPRTAGTDPQGPGRPGPWHPRPSRQPACPTIPRVLPAAGTAEASQHGSQPLPRENSKWCALRACRLSALVLLLAEEHFPRSVVHEWLALAGQDIDAADDGGPPGNLLAPPLWGRIVGPVDALVLPRTPPREDRDVRDGGLR